MAICDSCWKESNNLKYVDNLWICPECGGYKPKVLRQGYLTHNSSRLDRDRSKHTADMVQPHTYNRMKRREVVNPDFVKLYPDKTSTYFTGNELRQEGYHKLADCNDNVMKKKKGSCPCG